MYGKKKKWSGKIYNKLVIVVAFGTWKRDFGYSCNI